MPAKATTTKKDTPTYNSMIKEAIKSSKTTKGVSRQAILKFILSSYGVKEGAITNSLLRRALKSGVEKNELTQNGQRFKVTKKEKTPAKKTTTKKAAPKKSTTSKAKVTKATTAKKPAAKKTAVKKTPAKKAPTKKPTTTKKTTAKKGTKGKTSSK